MNIHKTIREQFPILRQKIGENPLVFLDNAATKHKPDIVIDAVANYYRSSNSNVNRSAHHLAARSEHIVEKVRQKVARWIQAKKKEEIIFTGGTTASLNLLANSYGEMRVGKNDEILVSTMEHHSNWLPWYALAKRKGAKLHMIPILPNGMIDIDAYDKLLGPRTKIVALSHVSNVLGTINPIQAMVAKARKYKTAVVIDAAQSIAHIPIDVRSIDCDFLVFSSHKMYGPTGLGILYSKKELLDTMTPWQLGGGMLHSLQTQKLVYEPVPHRFEAGTLHIAGIAGLDAALTFLAQITYPFIENHDKILLDYARQKLQTIPKLTIWGNAPNKTSIISFTIANIHSLDIGIKLDTKGIAVRTGNHCALPLMKALGIEGTVRISFALYNTKDDIDRLTSTLQDIAKTL